MTQGGSIDRRRLLAGLSFGAGWLGLAGCAPGDAGAQGPKLALTDPLSDVVPPGTALRIGDPQTQRVVEHNCWSLPFEVEWAQATGGQLVTEAFHAKALDVGLGANVPPIFATWVGIPVKIIAARRRTDWEERPSFVFGVSPKAEVESLADLRGKKIAFSPSQVQSDIVLQTLQAQGLTPSDVALVELPSSIGGDVYTNALSAGLVDVAPIGAGIVAEKYIRRYGRDGARLLHHGAFRDDLIVSFVRTEVLENAAQAAALKAYVQVWGRARAWIDSHRDEWIQAYHVDNQGLTPADGRLVVEAEGRPEYPRQWDDLVRTQQASIDRISRETGRDPFPAETLFDRRFETLGADAVLQGASS